MMPLPVFTFSPAYDMYYIYHQTLRFLFIQLMQLSIILILSKPFGAFSILLRNYVYINVRQNE